MKNKTHVYMTVSGIPINMRFEPAIEDIPFTMGIGDDMEVKITVSELETFAIFLKRNPQFKEYITELISRM